jgi:hypothetical protein
MTGAAGVLGAKLTLPGIGSFFLDETHPIEQPNKSPLDARAARLPSAKTERSLKTWSTHWGVMYRVTEK